MSLESTIICLDVSEYMRNGDYPPTRLESQQDAVTTLIVGKLGRNAESTVGLLAYGGKSIRLLNSPTEDEGKLLACLHGLQPEGPPAFTSAVKTAMLALKHRKNRNGGQRIIMFVGSPVDATPEELKKLGAVVKKNGIAVDIISMGENEANVNKLEAFVEAVVRKDGEVSNSLLLSVPAGVMPSDMLTGSPIYLGHDAFSGGGGAGVGAGGSGVGTGGAGGGGGFADYGGIDPTLDPELAMAMRISLEEARAAQQAGAPGDAPATPATGTGSASAAPAAPASAATGGAAMATGAMDEDELLRQALALSIADSQAATSTSAAPTPAAPSASAGSSAMEVEASTAPAPAGTAAAAAGGFADPSFALSMLGGMPGVDLNDPAIQEALRALQGGGAGGASGEGGQGNGADQSKK